jgi:hypothetical protein
VPRASAILAVGLTGAAQEDKAKVKVEAKAKIKVERRGEVDRGG